jgi:aldehyde dehydrogenase (NAD+)
MQRSSRRRSSVRSVRVSVLYLLVLRLTAFTVVVTRWKDEADLIKVANNSVYGLAAAVFSRDISHALSIANKLQAGTVWVNCYNQLHSNVPFGGYKQSGIGRELGEYALANYTNVKAVHINISGPAPM